jgi:hypothetical protein
MCPVRNWIPAIHPIQPVTLQTELSYFTSNKKIMENQTRYEDCKYWKWRSRQDQTGYCPKDNLIGVHPVCMCK